MLYMLLQATRHPLLGVYKVPKRTSRAESCKRIRQPITTYGLKLRTYSNKDVPCTALVLCAEGTSTAQFDPDVNTSKGLSQVVGTCHAQPFRRGR